MGRFGENYFNAVRLTWRLSLARPHKKMELCEDTIKTLTTLKKGEIHGYQHSKKQLDIEALERINIYV